MPKRILSGKIISCKNDKTVVVEVTRTVQHKLYKKIIKKKKRFHAHDESNKCNVGENVLIQESRPLSKLKKWIIISDLNESRQQWYKCKLI